MAEVATTVAEVRMPKLSDSMNEGTIVRWLKRSGDSITTGEELVEIETDKATVTYDAEASGTLTIVAEDGETMPVGAVIARIGSDDASSAPAPAAGNGARGARRPRAKASPVARRLARQLGVDPSELTGSGPGGRIVKRDVEAASSATAEPAAATGAKGQVRVLEASSVQLTIARRMAEAKATIPEFTLTTEVAMDAALDARGQLNRPDADLAPSINDFVIKACALALRRHPRVNGSYRDGHFELYERVNIGVAVAAREALLVPTVFDADTKSLGRIAAETRELAERARAARLTPPELSGGTFTVSNLGMFGVTQFTAILNPPQAAILAVGSVQQRVVFADGKAVSRHVMTMTLTCDHRILYGADAAVFLSDVRELLEQPVRMLL